jgi:hypothetical protein
MNPLQYAARIAYSTIETLNFTYETALHYRYHEGVFCECGVAAGAQIIAMAHAAPNKTIYAFDSFEGIPLPSNRDDQMPGLLMLSPTEQKMLPDPGAQVLESSGATVVTLDEFKNHCIGSGVGTRNIKPVRGWFEETVQNFGREKIALLRLDGDLYNSTFVCLKHMFPKVIKGGCVIIDDYELPGCRGACDDYFNLIGYTPEYKSVSNIKYIIK